MVGFIIVFEIATLGVLPLMFRQLPIIWRKRKYIREHRKISVAVMEQLFSGHPTDL